ncbi:MAG: tetratricopeptide repeat protein, partial [Pyrinomonadaceae bacterium]|nr:tetratricopeptide repeat protein [Pyrinomonadaceae bacterium]
SSFSRGLMALAGVVLVTIIGLGYWYYSGGKQIESIAVMPFVNESGDKDVEYLSDGMTETLISSLSQLRDLDVKPRSAVFRYKGKENDPQTAGNELKVEAVLTGRITQRGDDISLYAELIDVAKNKTMWSKSYKRKQSALVALQSDIARDVSSRITTVLSGADEENVTNLYTKNSEAYQLYLKGNFYTSKLTKEGFEKGNEFFEQAITQDPNYALAYNGIAFNQLAAMDWFSAPKIAGPKAKAAVEKAVELNEELAETQLFRGMVAHWVDWDWKTAEAAYKKAIDLDPDAFRPNGYYSWFLANMGRNDEAVAVATRCQQADPISPEANWYLGAALLAAGRSEDSIARLQTAIDLEPSYFYAHAFQGRAYLQAGRRKEALEAFKRAHKLESNNFENWANLAYAQGVNGNEEEARKIIAYLKEKSEVSYVSPYYLAIAHAGLGDTERVFSFLELAIKDKSDSLILYLTADPQMEAIRTDPRYKVILKRINLPE